MRLECLVWVSPFDNVNVSCNGRERASPHSMSPPSAPKQVGSPKVEVQAPCDATLANTRVADEMPSRRPFAASAAAAALLCLVRRAGPGQGGRLFASPAKPIGPPRPASLRRPARSAWSGSGGEIDDVLRSVSGKAVAEAKAWQCCPRLCSSAEAQFIEALVD
eukprot:s4945_g6.t1